MRKKTPPYYAGYAGFILVLALVNGCLKVHADTSSSTTEGEEDVLYGAVAAGTYDHPPKVAIAVSYAERSINDAMTKALKQCQAELGPRDNRSGIHPCEIKRTFVGRGTDSCQFVTTGKNARGEAFYSYAGSSEDARKFCEDGGVKKAGPYTCRTPVGGCNVGPPNPGPKVFWDAEAPAPKEETPPPAPKTETPPPAPKAEKLPPTGVLHAKKGSSGVAPFNVIGAKENHYVVRLVNEDGRKREITIFVRAGSRYDGKVPFGKYRILTAHGTDWISEKDLFGDQTEFARIRTRDDGEVVNFYQDKTSTTTHGKTIIRTIAHGKSLTLEKIAGGNVERSHITRAEFEDN